MSIRDYIEKAIETSGLTDREIARRMHVAASTLNGLRKGDRRWNETNIRKFCEGMGIELETLVCSEKRSFPYYASENTDLHQEVELILTAHPAPQIFKRIVTDFMEDIHIQSKKKDEKLKA